jgi:large subunit ribosomal protein L11
MASKAGKAAAAVTKVKRKIPIKVIHPPFYKSTINAGQATPAPPLGTNLGQRGINVAQFVRDFNKATDAYIPGEPSHCCQTS